MLGNKIRKAYGLRINLILVGSNLIFKIVRNNCRKFKKTSFNVSFEMLFTACLAAVFNCSIVLGFSV